MTRDLPQFPNLDHLRKQAKTRLREMRRRNPNTKLSESQHAVAGDYGFPSWAKLKAYIESLPLRPEPEPAAAGSRGSGGGPTGEGTLADSPAPGLFPRFTERSRRLIFVARYFAARRGSLEIEPQDLLLAVGHEDPGIISCFLRDPSSADALRKQIEILGQALPATARIPLSGASRLIIEAAAAEADGLRHEKIKPGHFLLGAFRTDSLAVSVLVAAMAERGILVEQARGAVIRVLNEETA
jgi:hypothetical protein